MPPIAPLILALPNLKYGLISPEQPLALLPLPLLARGRAVCAGMRAVREPTTDPEPVTAERDALLVVPAGAHGEAWPARAAPTRAAQEHGPDRDEHEHEHERRRARIVVRCRITISDL